MESLTMDVCVYRFLVEGDELEISGTPSFEKSFWHFDHTYIYTANRIVDDFVSSDSGKEISRYRASKKAHVSQRWLHCIELFARIYSEESSDMSAWAIFCDIEDRSLTLIKSICSNGSCKNVVAAVEDFYSHILIWYDIFRMADRSIN